MLQGTLNDFTLADVFSLLALTKKTGALRVTSDGTDGQVLFRDGLICLALSDAKRVPLGARLVSAGLIDEDQVRATVQQNSGSSVAVTEALLASGQVEDRVLAVFLREQIVDAVFELMRLTEGSFNFDANAPALSRGVGLSVVDVVGEATRRLDEWQAIHEQIASPTAVLAMVPTAASGREGVTLVPEQWELLALIDGRRTVSDVVELTGRGEFATCRVLGDLVTSGLIQAKDRDGGQTDLDKLIAAREALRSLEQVEKSGINPRLSSAAPLAPGGSQIRWVEPPGDSPASSASRPAMMASRARSEERPATDAAAESKPAAPTAPVATAPSGSAPAPTASAPAAPAREAASAPAAAPAPAAAAPAPAAPKHAASPTSESKPTPAAVRSAEDAKSVASDADVGKAEPSAPVASPSGVDRAQVARELASLGIDDDDASPLTRDSDVNKGLLLRLIDGVKGA